jgi:hypothetical protein
MPSVVRKTFVLNVVMLNVVVLSHCAKCRYAECHCAKCRFAECHYVECRGAGPGSWLPTTNAS